MFPFLDYYGKRISYNKVDVGFLRKWRIPFNIKKPL